MEWVPQIEVSSSNEFRDKNSFNEFEDESSF